MCVLFYAFRSVVARERLIVIFYGGKASDNCRCCIAWSRPYKEANTPPSFSKGNGVLVGLVKVGHDASVRRAAAGDSNLATGNPPRNETG